ncbi:glycosyltransferase family 90 protein [Colletotrichum incanum]|nr:glycosyltransferase family 90 protein [Colletotrichum incanum]
MLVVYVAFEHGGVIGRTRFLPCVDFQRSILPLASRIVALLAACFVIETILFGFRKVNIPTTVALGFAKALSWYFTARAANDASWRIAPAVETFSVLSTRDPFAQRSELQALSHVAASVLSLGSVVHMIPQVPKRRSTLWVLAFASLGPYFANIFAIISARSAAQTFASQSQRHPVELFSRAASIKFENMLKSQSKNYTAARGEYERRYGLEPPPGFEAWYEFAVANQSPMIDDFDSIFDAVSPFLDITGEEIAKTIQDAYHAPGSDLWLCSFSGAQAEIHCEHAYRTFDRHIAASFNNRLEGINGGSIPNIKFLVNHLDEPRVLVPPPSTRGTGGRDAFGNERFRLKNMSGRPVGREIIKYCDSQKHTFSQHSNGVTTAGNVDVETYGLPFVADPTLAGGICQYPSQRALHGLIARPKSFKLIEGLVPVLSTGSLATMGDILFPSPAYMEDEFTYDEHHDVEWSKKSNNVYWAGSSTGGLASDERWQKYHRQRFVALAQNLQKPEQQKHVYLRQINGVIQRVTSSFLNSRLYDVAFTRIFQCERTQCRDQKSYFNVRSWVDKNEALRSRLVFDLDGNGISGRYYKLLASKSTPLKQTLLREWHDDRLVPWVHYLPVSLDMGELPELVTYLTTTEAGQRRAREVAEQGRDWYSKAFREVDLAIYTYRLLLELARLQDPTRQAS